MSLAVILSAIALAATGYLTIQEVSRLAEAQLREQALLTLSVFGSDIESLDTVLDAGLMQGRIDAVVKERPQIVRFTLNAPVFGQAQLTGYRTLVSTDPLLLWAEILPEVTQVISRGQVLSRTVTSASGQPALQVIAPVHVAGQAPGAVEIITLVGTAGQNAAQDRCLWVARVIDADLETLEDLLDSARLQKIVLGLGKDYPELTLISLHGPVYQQAAVLEYRKTASTDPASMGRLAQPELVAPIASGESVVTSMTTGGEEFLRVIVPIRVARKAIATADVLVSKAAVRAEAGRITRLSVLAALVALVLMTILLVWLLDRTVIRPISQLTRSAQAMAAGDLSQAVVLSRRDEVGILANAFTGMATQLRTLVADLEQRVTDRTRQLERRAVQLQAAAEVARAAASVLDPEELLRQVVELVCARFDLYYVGLFMLDPDKRFAVLRAGTGEAGSKMLKAGHQLDVGGQSMIGQCIGRGQARIALDVGAEAVRFENPLLPKTRSEMALLLQSRGQVIGAMTVQSTLAAAFDEADIAVMETMADQVAAAIDNARLFSEARRALQELEMTQKRYTGQAWGEYMSRRTVSGYARMGGQLKSLGGQILPEVQLAQTQNALASQAGGPTATASPDLVAPILLRGEPIGVAGFKAPEQNWQWSADDIALVETINEQVALAAENLRLFEETQRRAARERLINEITARIRGSVSMEAVLNSAVREISQITGASSAAIDLELVDTA